MLNDASISSFNGYTSFFHLMAILVSVNGYNSVFSVNGYEFFNVYWQLYFKSNRGLNYFFQIQGLYYFQ